MLISYKNIMNYLKSSNITLDEKEEIINKNRKSLSKLFEKVNADEVIDYLMDDLLPESFRIKLAKYVDLLNLRIDKESVNKLKSINLRFTNLNLFERELLYKDYYPMEFKKIIINKLYNNIFEILKDDLIPLEIKKAIIDEEKNIGALRNLFLYDINDDLIDYIIDQKLTDISDIRNALSNANIKDSIKNKIILMKINKNNICDVMNYSFFDETIRNKILELKKDEILSYVNEIKNRNLLNSVDYYSAPPEIIDKIFDLRKNEIENRVKRLNIISLSLEIAYVNEQRLANILINMNPTKTKLAINTMEYSILMKTLNNKYVPLWVKDYITSNKKKVNYVINSLTYSDIEYYCLKSTNLPIEFQNEILRLKKDVIKEGIMKIDDFYIPSYLASKNYNPTFKELILSIKINENNIFNIIKTSATYKNVISYIIERKSDVISNYLMKLSLDELVTLDNLHEMCDSIKNIIIRNNSKLIKNKLSLASNDELLHYLESDRVSFPIKEIILDIIGLKEEEKNNYIVLMKNNDPTNVIENYEKIKCFIEKTNTNFSSFIKYGAGFGKYNSLLTIINSIIDNNMVDYFIRVKDYLYENLYNINIVKNEVYNIIYFLQIIDAFNANPKLLINLTKQKRRLSSSDIDDLMYFFYMDSDKKKTFYDISQIHEYRIKANKSLIQNYSNLSLSEIKEYLNKYALCNAKYKLSNIGGSSALLMLKKYNNDSKELVRLIDELLYYAKITDSISNINSINDLRNIVKILLNDNGKLLIDLQNLFAKLDSKITRVYELDSKLNLTKISNIISDKSLINEELSIKYGGKTIDLSDKNYCLYAHVLSESEDIESMVGGKADGDSIFISVSPISYLGQRYYYNSNYMILAYDDILDGNFNCSSTKNMGSNGIIKNNSYEVKKSGWIQRGVLESSAVVDNNAECLLYREGLKPCGIILPGGRMPNESEMKYHEKYLLPFIITQPVKEVVNNPKFVFEKNNIPIEDKVDTEELKKLYKILNDNIKIVNCNEEYTGRQIAIITDAHAMYEPCVEVLEDIRKNKIDEIYSLGDNIGLGPNPKEVIDLQDEYGVKSVAGNSEYYSTLGIEPFSYFDKEKTENQIWTLDKLGSSRIKRLKLYPSSIDIVVGNKKVALCHFANDIRWDYTNHSTWNYQSKFTPGKSGEQFLYTNSPLAIEKIEQAIKSGKGNKSIMGYLSAKEEPLFNGKSIKYYDDVIQGHVHFDMKEKIDNTNIHTLRALAMGFYNENSNTACYYVLKEKKDGSFDIEKRLVKYNKNILISNILSSNIPHKEKVLRYIKA